MRIRGENSVNNDISSSMIICQIYESIENLIILVQFSITANKETSIIAIPRTCKT